LDGFRRWWKDFRTAVGDGLISLARGFLSACRPTVLWRSALISLVALGLTTWFFVWHWAQARFLSGLFGPSFLASSIGGGGLGYGGQSLTPTMGPYDFVGGFRNVFEMGSGLAHSAQRIGQAILVGALSIVCSYVFCAMALVVLGTRWCLLDRVRERTNMCLSAPSHAEPATHSPSGGGAQGQPWPGG